MNGTADLIVMIAACLLVFLIVVMIVARRLKRTPTPPANATSDLRGIVGDDRGPMQTRDDEQSRPQSGSGASGRKAA